MNNLIRTGLKHHQRIMVDQHLTVPAVSSAFTGFWDMPPVFATAYMVGLIEWACIEALRDHLPSGQHTVGTHVDVSHLAATPAGMFVTADVELIAIEGRKLRFKVACRDEAGLIGEGFHERAIIDQAKFMARVSAKTAKGAADV